jgi:hypothetical protein
MSITPNVSSMLKVEEYISKYLPEASDFPVQAHAKLPDFLPTADGDQQLSYVGFHSLKSLHSSVLIVPVAQIGWLQAVLLELTTDRSNHTLLK